MAWNRTPHSSSMSPWRMKGVSFCASPQYSHKNILLAKYTSIFFLEGRLRIHSRVASALRSPTWTSPQDLNVFLLTCKGRDFDPLPSSALFWLWSHLDFSLPVPELGNLKAYCNCPRTFQDEVIQKGGSLDVRTQNPTCVTWRADTLVGVLAVGMTSSSIQTRLGYVAEVRFRVLTILSREARSTLAGGLSYQRCSFTGSPVLTGIAFAGVSVLTVVSKKAFSTPATEEITCGTFSGSPAVLRRYQERSPTTTESLKICHI